MTAMISLHYEQKNSFFDTTTRKPQYYKDDSISLIRPQTPNGNEDEDFIVLSKPHAEGEGIVMSEKTRHPRLDEETSSDEMQVEYKNSISWLQTDELAKDFTKILFGQGLGNGETLVEIFAVSIHSNTKRRCKLNIHGMITIHSTYGISEIFRRTPKSTERITTKENVTLTGPKIANLGYDCFSIELDIKDGGREVSKGALYWDMYSTHCNTLFDQTLIRKVKGKNGHALITYAILQHSMLIKVEIKLPETIFRQNHRPMIYGRIDASIIEMPSSETTLFRKKNDNCAIISPDEGGALPLSKSLIALPIGRSIKISLHLNESLPSYSRSQIVRTEVPFFPRCFGDRETNVLSKYGLINVKITAYPPIFHPETSIAREIHMSEIYDSSNDYYIVSDSE